MDLDDTLWPIWPTIDRAELQLQEWLQARAPRTAALFANVHARLGLREQAQRDWPDQHHDLSFMRREMIRLGLQQSAEDQALASDAFEVFFAARQRVSLFDDARPALARLAARYPGYAWERNAGYGSAAHRDALHRLGITAHHRAGFGTVRQLSLGV